MQTSRSAFIFFIHIKRKVCKSCVNRAIKYQKTIVPQRESDFSSYLAVADKKYLNHKPHLTFMEVL